MTTKNFTELELDILNLVADFRNYDNVESEINDNAVGVYLRDVTDLNGMQPNIARGVLSSLVQKNMLTVDRVNKENFFRATDECIKFCYFVLDVM